MGVCMLETKHLRRVVCRSAVTSTEFWRPSAITWPAFSTTISHARSLISAWRRYYRVWNKRHFDISTHQSCVLTRNYFMPIPAVMITVEMRFLFTISFVLSLDREHGWLLDLHWQPEAAPGGGDVDCAETPDPSHSNSGHLYFLLYTSMYGVYMYTYTSN